MGELTHVDAAGKARMVDVGAKPVVGRRATAAGTIRLALETVALVAANALKKGEVLTVAEIAGIQAAKQTHMLIPLCHPLPLNQVAVKAELVESGVAVTATVSCQARTGIEMEALTAVSVALLTVYDMCKAVDKGMVIGPIQLVEKVKGTVEE